MRGRTAALFAALVWVGACGFSTRSGEYRCDPGGCDDGRACVDGWCVEPGTLPSVDADVGPFTCDGVTCTLECGAGECAQDITCPAGRACSVTCSGADACGGSIDCSAGTSCDVECTGPRSCGRPIECGSGSCRVECAGDGSCASTVDCDDACACDLTCAGEDACGGSNQCAFNQCTLGNECLVSENNCDRC